MEKRWIILFVGLIAVSIFGLFIQEPPSLWNELPEEVSQMLNAADIAWMITAAGLVMLMTPGLSFFYGGMVRSKNVISTMVQSVVVMGLISIVWVVVGFSLAFGDSWYGLVGDPRTFFMFTGLLQSCVWHCKNQCQTRMKLTQKSLLARIKTSQKNLLFFKKCRNML